MKFNKIHTLILGLLFSASGYAQTDISYLNVNYTYDPSMFDWTEESMGTLTFSQGFQAKVLDVQDDEGAYYIEFGGYGTLTVYNRTLMYNPDFKSVNNQSSLYFGDFTSTIANSQVGSLSIEANDNEGSWELNDPYRQYWFGYNIAKLSESQGESDGLVFVRGSEIPSDVEYDYVGYPISHKKYVNELFYSQEKEGDEIVYKPVYSFDVSRYARGKNFNAEYVNDTKLFKVTEIPSNAFNGNTSYINLMIGSSITSIKQDLSAKVISNYDVEAGNQYFSSALGGDILCNKNGTTVIGVAEDIGTKTLPASVALIAENSVYVSDEGTGIKLSSANESLVCNDTRLVPWTLNEDEKVNSLKINATFVPSAKQTIAVSENYIKESKKSNGSTYTSASVTKEYFVNSASAAKAYIASLAGDKSVCYVDLSNCKFDAADLGYINMATVNANCLLFLPEGVTAAGNNIVTKSGGTRACSSLVLERATGLSFATPYQFTAASVTVNASITDKVLGFVLPFDYANEDVKFATFKSFAGGTIYLDNTKKNVPANVPFLAIKDGDVQDQAISASGVEIYPANIQPTFDGGWTMSGSYQTVTNNEASNYSVYGFTSDGVLKKANGASFKPFSSFFVCNNSNASEAKLRYVSEDFSTGVEDALETAFVVTAESGSIKVAASGVNVVIASINGAVLYEGIVNGTIVKDVNPGVYVVNGKKIIVNK